MREIVDKRIQMYKMLLNPILKSYSIINHIFTYIIKTCRECDNMLVFDDINIEYHKTCKSCKNSRCLKCCHQFKIPICAKYLQPCYQCVVDVIHIKNEKYSFTCLYYNNG